MINEIRREGDPSVPIWLDVTDPTAEELGALAKRYRLHPALIADCLQPMHLPKHEPLGEACTTTEGAAPCEGAPPARGRAWQGKLLLSPCSPHWSWRSSSAFSTSADLCCVMSRTAPTKRNGLALGIERGAAARGDPALSAVSGTIGDRQTAVLDVVQAVVGMRYPTDRMPRAQTVVWIQPRHEQRVVDRGVARRCKRFGRLTPLCDYLTCAASSEPDEVGL